MSGVQNQTDPADIGQGNLDDLGTGVFAVPDPASADFGATTRMLVDKITYQECVKRGLATVAFKWVPHKGGVMNKDLKEKCPVAGMRCVDRCVPPGCMCLNGICT